MKNDETLRGFSHYPAGFARVVTEPQSRVPSRTGRIPTGDSIIEPDSVLEEDGRTYHGYKEGKYFLPNDPDEQDRLDFQHSICTMLLDGKLALAPVGDNPGHVMDVATGTGLWALEFALENPRSKIIGSDLSKIQPDLETLVPNCEFIKEDSEDEWVYDHKFDYVHLRFCVTCFTDHRTVIGHAFKNMNPGGWIEYQDTSPDLCRLEGSVEDMALGRWFDLIVRGAAALGRDVNVTHRYKDMLIEAGFVDVVEIRIPLPLNPWPENPKSKRIGELNRWNWCHGALDVTRKMLGGSGLSQREIDELISDSRREIADENNQIFMPFWVVYGRKPHGEKVAGDPGNPA